jgi:hypothetical protein
MSRSAVPPPTPAAIDARILAALRIVLRAWNERLAWLHQQRACDPAAADGQHAVLWHALGFLRISHNVGERSLAYGEALLRGEAGIQPPVRLAVDGSADAWDPVTQPIPGLDGYVECGACPITPDYSPRWDYRQFLASHAQWMLSQALGLVGAASDGRGGWVWGDFSPHERRMFGAGIAVMAQTQAELCAVVGIPPHRPPVPGWADGRGLPELFTLPDLAVWHLALPLPPAPADDRSTPQDGGPA